VYRFLGSPKWIGFALFMIVLAAVMVALGFWQLDRYHLRHGINVRIDRANAAAPVPWQNVASLDHPVADGQEWTRVTLTGTYDTAGTVVARERTVNDSVGVEILTPLRLDDGSLVMVDRGWLPSSGASATELPTVPPAPAGDVTIVGRIHQPESRADQPVRLGGALTIRRINPAKLTGYLTSGGGHLYPDYLLLDSQQPGAPSGVTAIPADHEPSWMNAGYTVQWWAFAALTLAGFAWAARREAHDRRDGVVRPPRAARQPAARASRDRLADDVTA
jgi:cytochrome oxidase assembly protein ShyY1